MSTVQSDLSRFERMLEALGETVEKVDVEIVSGAELQSVVTRRRIQLGSKVLRARGHLLKSLKMAWLLQINSSLVKNLTMLEVLSDFFFSTSSGGLELVHPFSGKIARYADSEVRRQMYSQKELCESAWVPMSQLVFCQSLSNPNAEAEAVSRAASLPSPLSIRHFLGLAFWKKYKSVGVSERVGFLKMMVEVLKKQDFSRVEIPLDFRQWNGFARDQLKFFER